MSINVKLLNEIPHYYHRFIPWLKKPAALHRLMHSGRCTGKSATNAILWILDLMLHPGTDLIVVVYEYDSVSKGCMGDFRKAFGWLKLTNNLRPTFNDPVTGKKYIRFKYNGDVHTILFEHGKGKAEALHGMNPTAEGRKWIGLWYYELSNFLTWDDGEIMHTNSGFLRNGHENFKIVYEFNTPRSGFGAAWVLPWVEKQREKELDFINRREYYLETFRQVGYELTTEHLVDYQFNTYLDMTPEEIRRMIPPMMYLDIKSEEIANPLKYREVYLGEQTYSGDACYPELNQGHLGFQTPPFTVDEVRIGIDIGRVDATVCTCTEVQMVSGQLKINAGVHVWYHSNNFAEFEVDGIRKVYKHFDIADYTNMIISFVAEMHRLYPRKILHVNIDYANEGQSIYDMWLRYGTPDYIRTTRVWRKASIPARIDTMNMLFRVPGLVKIVNRGLYNVMVNTSYSKNIEDIVNNVRKRKDDGRNKLIALDRLDSFEYCWNEQEWNNLYSRAKDIFIANTHIMQIGNPTFA